MGVNHVARQPWQDRRGADGQHVMGTYRHALPTGVELGAIVLEDTGMIAPYVDQDDDAAMRLSTQRDSVERVTPMAADESVANSAPRALLDGGQS